MVRERKMGPRGEVPVFSSYLTESLDTDYSLGIRNRDLIVNNRYRESSALNKTGHKVLSHKMKLEGRWFRDSAAALISPVSQDPSRFLCHS